MNTTNTVNTVNTASATRATDTAGTETGRHPTDRHGSAVVTLPSDTEILITRSFDAPSARVFEAWTTPDLVRQWWGFETSPLTVCDIDLRVGGNWRYVTREPDGTELGWHGTYHEIDAPGRLVSSEVFEGYPDAEAVNSLTLVEEGELTTMRILIRHSTQANRDGHIESGMEGGMQLTMDRLEDLLGRSGR